MFGYISCWYYNLLPQTHTQFSLINTEAEHISSLLQRQGFNRNIIMFRAVVDFLARDSCYVISDLFKSRTSMIFEFLYKY